jgi:osmotically-inducible protein OsmY
MDERFGRRYEDEERRFSEPAPREYEGRRYRGEGYYGGYYGPERSRGTHERRGGGPEERGFLNRAGDELRSWFGDEEAEYRRRQDEREARGRGWPSERWGQGRERGGADDLDERGWARQWGYVESPYERGGMRDSERWGEGARRPSMREESWMTRGPYAGRGPKGYHRSDERIREDVCDRLCEHGGIDASDMEIQVVGSEVTLLGTVSSRWQKRLAEDVADSVSGVSEVHNQLRVTPSQPSAAPGQPGQPGATDWRNRAA